MAGGSTVHEIQRVPSALLPRRIPMHRVSSMISSQRVLALAAVALPLALAACNSDKPIGKGKGKGGGEAEPSGAGTTAHPGEPPAPVKKPPPKAPPRGPEHALYSLVDNRLSAHLVRGAGLFLPAGSA